MMMVMEAAITCIMLVQFYQTIGCNIPDGSHLHICCQENMKSDMNEFLSNMVVQYSDLF
jgi:hypothetical protein